MIYLFVQFSKPAKLDDESDDEDDMIQEFDKMRDPNMDMMYSVKQMGHAGFQRIKDVSLHVDQDVGMAE